LWPTAISLDWATAHYDPDHDAAARRLFTSLQQSIQAQLRAQRQSALSESVRKITISTRHTGPPEQYTQGPSTTFTARWAHTRQEAHAADLALQFYTIDMWQMAGTDINAYYDPQFNQVYLTPAITRALWSASYSTRVARLGFVIAHEIGHALHSQDTDRIPIGSRAAYTAGVVCLMDEFGVNGTTVQEDMADRVAAAAVIRMLAPLGMGTSRALCNPHCVSTTGLGRSLVEMAQVWCSTTPEAHYNQDPHSPNRARVDHSLRQTPAIMATWGCAKPTREATCTVIGA